MIASAITAAIPKTMPATSAPRDASAFALGEHARERGDAKPCEGREGFGLIGRHGCRR
jgi:hypothetical protein